MPELLPVRFGPQVEQSSQGIPKDGFSAAYGPFRRFTGGSKEWDSVFKSYPSAAAHLSVFGEDIALTEAIDFLRILYIKKLDKENIDYESVDGRALWGITKFINQSNLLPPNVKIQSVNSETINLIDGNGIIIPITQMSDGFRSILSLVLELLRQLIQTYGSNKVFREILSDDVTIQEAGIVLIDEVDAHLHPTWQTRIGEWFTQYFPNIQFIVTTHSPLVCRAAENGTIWQLPAPGSDKASYKIEEREKKRLVFGNILDAYGTQAFGDNVTRSESSNEKLNELAELNIKSIMGSISPEDEGKLNELRSIFPTEG
ncbi:AAA family ATPase [Spirosoma pomorum]